MNEVERTKEFEKKSKKIIKRISKLCLKREIILDYSFDFKNDIILDFRKTKYNKVNKVSYPYMDYTQCHVLHRDIIERPILSVVRDVKGFIKMAGMW